MSNVNDMIAALQAKQAQTQGAPAIPGIAPAIPAAPQIPVTALPSAPPAAPYWRPGMPMNATQTYLRSKGMLWSAVADAADAKPSPEVAAMYDTAYDAQGSMVGAASTNPGVINPPEAPHIAPANTSFMPAVTSVPTPQATAQAVPATPVAPVATAVNDALTPLADREQVKAYAVQLGCVPGNTRMRIDGLKEAIRAHWLKHGNNAVAPPAPEPEETTVSVPTPAPVLTPSTVAAIPEPEEVTMVGGKGFVLYINCIPLLGGLTMKASNLHLDTLLAESGVLEQTSKVLGGISDYRLAEYGKGAGALSACLSAFLTEQGWGPDVAIFCDSRTAEGAVCLPVLCRHASLVIRGI